jgi:PAS domain S-box-containing protein
MSFIEITHPEDREKDLEKFRRLVRGEVAEYRNEKRYLRKDGRVTWVQVDVTLLRDGQGRPLRTVAIVQDISERKRAESQLSTQYAVSRILSESASIDEAAPRLIQSVCKLLDWKLGEIWQMDREASLLTCREIWHPPSSELAEFASASRGFTFPPGVGLPGRVWKNCQPAWIADILSDGNFPRASLAAKVGLRSALGFPILFGGEALGVIVLISREARKPDEDLLQMFASIGSQIGQFIGQKRAEESLRRSEQNLQDFFQNATVGLNWVGSDGIILRANQAELDMLGYAREEYVGHPIAEFHADPQVADDILRRLAAGETLSEYEAQLRHKDGTIRHALISANVLWNEGRFVHTRCFTRDITGRKRAEEELHRLSAHLLDLQDEERRRIARQLHDVTAQNLFAISINLASLRESNLLPPRKLTVTLAECQSLCEQSLQEIRTLSYLLHPPMLDQAGLVSALQWYIDGFAKRSGIDVGLVVTQEIGRLPREMETDLFRVVQEGLANIHRHSGSSTATVRLEKKATQLTLQIIDQGHGMPERAVTAVLNRVESLGVGLAGMRQRLRQLGGWLKIDSDHQGTTVTATVPLPTEDVSRRAAGQGAN